MTRGHAGVELAAEYLRVTQDRVGLGRIGIEVDRALRHPYGLLGVPGVSFAAAPQGQLTWGVHISLAPTWFDPAETPALITPFMVLYALHDAIVKPMPGQPLAPCRAETVTASEDGLSYDFVLRQGATFHNGDPVTADDVKFSFERYRGASHDVMKSRVAAIESRLRNGDIIGIVSRDGGRYSSLRATSHVGLALRSSPRLCCGDTRAINSTKAAR